MLKKVLVDYNPVALLLSQVVGKVSLLGDLSNHFKDLLFSNDDSTL